MIGEIVAGVADAAVTVAVAGATAEVIVADAVSSQTAGTVEVAASGNAYANKNAPRVRGAFFVYPRPYPAGFN